MAPVVAAVAAFAATTIGSFVVGLVANLVIGLVTHALFGKPKPKGPADRGWSTMVRSAEEPLRVVVGEHNMAGLLVDFASSGNNNEYLHIFLAFAGHRIRRFGTVYLNDLPSTDARYSGHVRVNAHEGAATQPVDSDAAAEVPGWATTRRGDGTAYLYCRFRWHSDKWPNGAPNVRPDLWGADEIPDPRDGTEKWTRNPALIAAWYMTSEFGFGIAEARIDQDYLIEAANICEEIVDIDPQATTFTAATSDLLSLAHNRAGWETGDRVTVASDGTLPGGLSAAGTYYYIRESSYGPGPATGYLATSVANALAGTAVNVTSTGSGSHTITRTGHLRYTCDGAWSLDEKPIEILEDIVACMAGCVTRVGGAFRIHAGAPWLGEEPALDVDALSGRPAYRRKVPIDESFNAVGGLYTDPRKYWQSQDFPEIGNPLYVAEDGGIKRRRDVSLRLVLGEIRAQRLAKIHLEQSRQSIRITLPLNLRGLAVVPWGVFTYSDAAVGWSAKKFRCLKWSLTGPAKFQVVAQEYAAEIYDWAGGDATASDPAPDTNLTSPFTIGTVSALALASGTDQLLELGEGSVISRIQVDWTAPDAGFVDRYDVEFKRAVESDWTPAPVPANRDTTRVYIGPVRDGTAYDVRVRAINTFGVAGAWAQAAPHVVVGKSEPPPMASRLTVERLADGTRRFNVEQDDMPADVRSGGGWDIRWALGPETDFTAMATLVTTGLLRSFPFETNELAAGTYTFAVKTVDSSGNYSADALFTEATLGDPRLENVLLTRQEHVLGWPGTLTDCWIYHGALYPVSAQTIADLPATIAGLAASIDDLVTAKSPIAYETPVMDLGADTSFNALVSVVANGSVTVTMQTGTTSDGAPTGAYVTAGVAAGARYVKIKIEVAGALPTLAQVTILLDGDEQVDEFVAVDTASETEPWFESVAAGHFRIGSKSGRMASITTAQITAFRGLTAGGWSWTVVNTSSTVDGEPAAEFKIWNPAGSLADAVVDVRLTGPQN